MDKELIHVCKSTLISNTKGVCAQSCRTLTLWTAAPQAPLSMGFSRQEYWTGLPFLPPGDLLDPRIQTRVSCIQAEDSLPLSPSRYYTNLLCPGHSVKIK